MKTIANVFGLLIIGLVIVQVAKNPKIVTDFFNGTKSNLGLLTA